MTLEQYLGCFEQGRLFKDKTHTIEYFTTMHFLNKFLPKNCSVLDCCAGGGVYSFALAKEGYAVTVGDLIEAHIDAIKSKNDNNDIKNIYCGDVLNLPFEADTFNAVLCMGGDILIKRTLGITFMQGFRNIVCAKALISLSALNELAFFLLFLVLF